MSTTTTTESPVLIVRNFPFLTVSRLSLIRLRIGRGRPFRTRSCDDARPQRHSRAGHRAQHCASPRLEGRRHPGSWLPPIVPFQNLTLNHVQPRSLEVYRALGIVDTVLSESFPSPPARVYAVPGGTEVLKEWQMITQSDPTPDCPYVCFCCGHDLGWELTGAQLTPCLLGQEATERIMREALLTRFGIAVELGTELVGFEQDAEGVSARLRKDGASEEEVARVRYLVGTDGGRSTVRRTLGLAFDGETMAETIIYGDVAVKGLEHDVRALHIRARFFSRKTLVRADVRRHGDPVRLLLYIRLEER
jgi:2-polyprenyl-6-methoxyphenol hydroxylase-like FAD-dependent oxidoreductase